jgi:hypothetical protein
MQADGRTALVVLGACLAVAMAPTDAQASATYAGSFTPGSGYQGTTPRHISLSAIGNHLADLHISGGKVRCTTNAQPAHTFFYNLPALSGFASFGFGIPTVSHRLDVIFTQATVMKPGGLWALSDGTPINETADVRLYGKWNGLSGGYTGLVAINYSGDAEGRPTTNPNTGNPETTMQNVNAGSSCTLDEIGTLRRQ